MQLLQQIKNSTLCLIWLHPIPQAVAVKSKRKVEENECGSSGW